MSSPIKWRLNLVIHYEMIQNIPHFRDSINGVLKGIASLHNIDCEIAEYHLPPDEIHFFAQGGREGRIEIAHFRSSSDTLLSAKELRGLISDIFCRADLSFYGIDISSQSAKLLRLYPFPK